MDEPSWSKLKTVVAIGSIGTAQLIAWGALYYAIAVMADALRRPFGLTDAEIFGAFATSVALSGLLAPWIGTLVDRHGGRAVLTLGPFFGGTGFVLLATAEAVGLALVALALQGIAMAMSLYDPCFAALSRQYPHAYRRAVTFVTLVAGLASTVFWPATHYWVGYLGWRSTCLVFALLLFGAACLNYLAFTPAHPPAVRASRTDTRDDKATPSRVRWLIAAFAGLSFVSAALSAHLPAALRALQFDAELAVWIAAAVGVMQVVGRALEFASGTNLPASKLGLVTFAAVFVALLVLLGSTGKPFFAIAFALVYGAANGVLTVVGAVLPRELFGAAEIGAVLGRFAAPARVARAAAPWTFSVVAAPFGTWGALACVASVAGLSLATYLFAVPTTTSNGRCARQP